MEVAIQVQFEKHDGVIGWPSCACGNCMGKPQFVHLQTVDKGVGQPDRIVGSNLFLPGDKQPDLARGVPYT